ncbi:MAG: SDR family NAD(P)-dependent oxidoreductase [Hyphomicrobiaceae bacterium]
MAARWNTAWVTGASTGIGRELAVRLARDGVRVAISARSGDKLDELVRAHPELQGRLLAVPLDVTDRASVAAAHRLVVDALGSIDLAVLNAGVWHPMKAVEYDAVRAAQSMEVNYFGIVNVLEPLVPAMINRGNGQLALVASVAGYRGLPMAAAYAPTKAAVISLAEVLRLELAQHNIVVSLVNPGFVETPMTAVNTFPMPFILKVEDAAERIIRGLESGRFETAFPWPLVAILKTMRVMPNWLYLRLAARFR